jgi:phosphatidylinositol glycan class S
LIDTLSDILAPYAPSDSHDRVVQYAPRYRLAFTLLNEDAAAGQAVHGWDIQDAIAREWRSSFIRPYIDTPTSEEHLSPNLLRLSVLHNFTIESQVQFHAPLAFKPTPISVDDRDAYGLRPEDLTVFVNSAQWTLCEHSGSFTRIRLVNIVVNIASSVSNDPVLHFILYVPSVTQRPLYILDADGTRFTQASFALTDSRQNQVQHLSQLPSSCPNGVA